MSDHNDDAPAADLRRLRLSTGATLAYRQAGDPARPAVVLIHGFPNASGGFRHVIPGLAEVAHVIAPDMPGSGASGKRQRYVGPPRQLKTLSCPVNPWIAPYTNGFPASTHASFTR